MTKLSFVILSYNSERCIEECLSRLLGSLGELGVDHEIWVIDNGSADSSREILAKYQGRHPSIQIIQLERNHGTTAARNLALVRAAGDMICILDSDAYVNSSAIGHLMKELKRRPDIGLVAPKLEFPDGRFQLSYDQFPTVTRKLQRFFLLRSMETKQMPEPTTVDYAISAFWMMSREAFEAVGLFDERFTYAPEDVDYCLRMWTAGYKVYYDPRVSIVHDAQEKSRGGLNEFTLKHIRGLAYYFLKHKYALSADRLRRRIGIPHE